MEPSPWMGPPENMSGIQKLQFSLTKKQKKQMEPSPWMGTPENMSGIQKLQFSLTKKKQKNQKKKQRMMPYRLTHLSYSYPYFWFRGSFRVGALKNAFLDRQKWVFSDVICQFVAREAFAPQKDW